MAVREQPIPNSGFTAIGGGWVKVWLKNDGLGVTGRDLYVVHGRYYPLAVGMYELVDAPDGTQRELQFAWEGRGGYTRSLNLVVGSETDRIPANVGLYVGAVTHTPCDPTDKPYLMIGDFDDPNPRKVEVASGDFYPQRVVSVGFPFLGTVKSVLVVQP